MTSKDAQMLKSISGKGSYYGFTKDGKPDMRFKLAREVAAKHNEGLYRVNQAKRKDTRTIAETTKRKRVQRIKKASFRERVTSFFRVLFILATVISIPVSYVITERIA